MDQHTITRIAKNLVAASRWDELVDVVESVGDKNAAMMLDFIGEVLNGGLQQAIENSYANDIDGIVDYAANFKNIGGRFAVALERQQGNIRDYLAMLKRSRHDDSFDSSVVEEKLDQLEKFDDWFYQNDDKIVADFIDFLRA